MLESNSKILIDSHTHLDQYSKNDLSELLSRAKSHNIERIIVAGINIHSSQQIMDMINTYPNFLYAGVGIHPMEIQDSMNVNDLQDIEKLVNTPNVVCISEIGLDYEVATATQDLQKTFFRNQLQIAQDHKKTVVFHNRGAGLDPIKIIDEEVNNGVNVVAHYFQGTKGYAYSCLDSGMYLSISKTVLRLPELQDLIRYELPLDRIILETDSYPQPFKKNRMAWTEPWQLTLIARKIAELKDLEFEEVCRTTTANSNFLFGWN